MSENRNLMYMASYISQIGKWKRDRQPDCYDLGEVSSFRVAEDDCYMRDFYFDEQGYVKEVHLTKVTNV